MIKKLQSNISSFTDNHRLFLWILLLILSATILVFPMRIEYVYSPIQSFSVFGSNILAFGFLYCIWLLIILLLLFTSLKTTEWQRVTLLCIFAVIFYGVWIIHTPFGSFWDELWQLGHVKYLRETGRLAPQVLGYFSFPALHLFNAALYEISGLGIFEIRTLFLLFSIVLLTMLLYLLFIKSLKNSNLSSLAVLIIIHGSYLSAMQTFWPGNMAFLFLIILLILAYRQPDGPLMTTTSMVFVTIILIMIFTMTYLPTPIAFIFILFGVFFLQMLARRNIINWSIITLCAIVLFAWLAYYAISWFSSVVSAVLPALAQGFMTPMERLPWLSSPIGNYLGVTNPLWVRLTRLIWLVFTFGLGGILGIFNIVKARKLKSIEVLETGGLIGVAVFTIFCVFTFTWETQWIRFMVLAPLFTVPIMLRFFSNSSIGGQFRRYVFILPIIIIVVLSLPTFLIQLPAINGTTNYSYDIAAGNFMESSYTANQVNVFTTINTGIQLRGFLMGANIQSSPDPFSPPIAINTLWKDMNTLVDNFESSNAMENIFVLSEKFTGPVGYPSAIQTSDPNWQAFVKRLAENDMIYNNGSTEVFQH